MSNKFTVFTKPWRTISLEKLCELVKDMGFDGVEYPLRNGYQVEPSAGSAGIKKLVDTLKSFDLTVESIAGGIDVKYTSDNKAVGLNNEDLFAGCGENGIKIIRICQGFDSNIGFFENIDQIKRAYDIALPYCEKYGVTIGVQMHYGSCVSNSAETYILLKDYDPKYIAAVWDSGHSGLAGGEAWQAIDNVYDMLCMVNFKAAYWRRVNGPEQVARFEPYWTTGANACGSWKSAVDILKKKNYNGVVCLPAEYSDEPNVEKYTREDIKFIKGLF